MLNHTDHPTPGNRSQPDYQALWLNYETKLDVLRGQFLTIAGLLFTLQAGIFVLMLDKMFDDKRVDAFFLFEIIVAVISAITWGFFLVIVEHFSTHLDNNIARSKRVRELSEKTSLNVEELKNDIDKNLKGKNQNHDRPDHRRIVQNVQYIYHTLLVFTTIILVIDIIICTNKNP